MCQGKDILTHKGKKLRNTIGLFIFKMCNGIGLPIRQILMPLNLHGRNLNAKHDRQNQHGSITYSNHYTQLVAIHYPTLV